ncbi:hypothetical protein [Cupriavidus sp. USMAA2-4]|uniref:hypothetical protein n=1 Tax=Cupriavidus sp. USMAA2-4 TaxID=876364 RepID=UPI0012F4F6DF|nr:hypothetical protein [Cupriavidus sp. USMAA2-4]
MNCFCTLFINSRHNADLPVSMFSYRSISQFDFTDNESPERLAMRSRLEMKGILQSADRPRYWWNINTDGKVSGSDIDEHIAWLVARVRPGRLLNELSAAGYGYFFSVFWPGNGTGGGPLITLRTVEMLASHRAELGVGFYYDDASGAG